MMKLFHGLAVSCLLVSLTTGAFAGTPMSGADLQNFWMTNSDFTSWMSGKPVLRSMKNYQKAVLAKAAPDECFCGVSPLGTPPPNPTNNPPPCTGDCKAKVNQAYVWGLTLCGSNLWFGTAANVHCLVIGAYLNNTNPIQTESFVGEFGHSYASQVRGLPAKVGDWRPPRLYVYDTAGKTLIEKDGTNVLPSSARTRLATTLGIRSAATWPGSTQYPARVVLLAGPTLATNGGLSMFAFDGDTGAFIASTNLLGYNNIRKWLVHDGVLYTAVGRSLGSGRALRWNPNPAQPGYPFAFEVVGDFDGSGAELEIHEGRMFVSTWPGYGAGRSGLWMSPVIPPGGLDNTHTGLWTKVWVTTDYEPDPVVAATYGAGALASFDGYLYWGTMHVPGFAMQAVATQYGLALTNQDVMLAAGLGTHRAISIFRGRHFSETNIPNQNIDLAYGFANMPVYNAASNQWELTANKMGKAPLFGWAGFGNLFNNYTWTMDTYQSNLYVGTMDFGYVGWDMLPLFLGADQIDQIELYFALNRFDPTLYFGADLFCFRSSANRAVPVMLNGMGNYSSYGIRTMVSTSNRLYLGMANPMNLMTDTNDAQPEGGWELIALKKLPACQRDFDRDGKTDIAVFRASAGKWFVSGSSQPVPPVTFGVAGDIPVPGHYDNDGILDYGVFRPGEARWYIFRSSIGPLTPVFGAPTDVPVPADYDGDGQTDIAVFRPGTATWFILRSSLGQLATTFGAPGDRPVPADYDGDGIADFAVFRPATATWYIYGSTMGSRAWVYGSVTDIPDPGDYDGDGRADLAVFRSALGKWFIHGTAAGSTSQVFGATTDLPIR
jgi:hypothetical protein